jgi:hypothetical protein
MRGVRDMTSRHKSESTCDCAIEWFGRLANSTIDAPVLRRMRAGTLGIWNPRAYEVLAN